MNNDVNVAPQGNNGGGELDALLDKYLNKGGDPASTSTAAPLNFRFGNETISVKSTEELQGELDKRLATIAAAYQQEQARYQQELQSARLQNVAPPPPPSQGVTPGETSGKNDPMEFVQNLVSDPRGTIEQALSEKLQKLELLERQFERQQFTMSHPLYAQGQIMTGLEKLCEANKMPVTAQNLEMAASWATRQGLIPDENVFREQQRQQLMQMMAGQQAQNQGGNVVQMPPQGQNFNDYVRSPHAQYMTPPPPPSTTGVQNSYVNPSQIEMAERLAPQMSTEDLKAFINKAGGNVG